MGASIYISPWRCEEIHHMGKTYKDMIKHELRVKGTKGNEKLRKVKERKARQKIKNKELDKLLIDDGRFGI